MCMSDLNADCSHISGRFSYETSFGKDVNHFSVSQSFSTFYCHLTSCVCRLLNELMRSTSIHHGKTAYPHRSNIAIVEEVPCVMVISDYYLIG